MCISIHIELRQVQLASLVRLRNCTLPCDTLCRGLAYERIVIALVVLVKPTNKSASENQIYVYIC